MNKIAINLLPQEILFARKQSTKLSLINKLSIALLVIMVFFTSATLVVRFIQNSDLNRVKDGLAYAESRVTSFREKEVQLAVLKKRLALIDSITLGDAQRKAMFNLLVNITPPDVSISDMAVDRGGNISASFNSQSLASIDVLFSNLSSQDKNLDLINKVDLDGISVGKSFNYRFALKIFSKNNTNK